MMNNLPITPTDSHIQGKPLPILYKYLDPSGAIKTLENSTLRFSIPTTLNDPFECLYGDMPDGYIQQLIDLLYANRNNPAKWIQLFKERLGFPPDRALAVLSAVDVPGVLEDFVSGTIRTFVARSPSSHKKTLRKIAISSFSENPLNILMWGHYATKHTGCVIGFDRDGLARFHENGLMKVSYSNERIPQPMSKEDARTTANLSVRTKSIDWEYEQEWRLIMPVEQLETRDGVLVRSFPPDIIREITLGVRVDPLLEQTAMVFAYKNKECRLMKAHIHPREYRIGIGPYDEQEETP